MLEAEISSPVKDVINASMNKFLFFRGSRIQSYYIYIYLQWTISVLENEKKKMPKLARHKVAFCSHSTLKSGLVLGFMLATHVRRQFIIFLLMISCKFCYSLIIIFFQHKSSVANARQPA